MEDVPPDFKMAVCTLIGTVAGLLFGWLRDRDKMQHDARLSKMEDKMEHQSEQLRDCQKQHVECEEKHKQLSAEMKSRDRADKEDLERQIAELRQQVSK